MRRPALLALALTLSFAGTLGACGNTKERTALDRAPSERIHESKFPRAGMTVGLPESGVAFRRTRDPGVFRAAIGQSVLAAYAYRRREEIPDDDKKLKKALERLERAAKERSSSLRISEAKTTKVGGVRAIELLGTQTISGGSLRTRSLHLFKGQAEYVIELLAPEAEFDRVDEILFPPIRRTLTVTGRVKAAGD